MKPKVSKRLNLSVQYACDRENLPARTDFVRWARAALNGGAEIAIRLVEATESQALNKDYRGKDYATNVLSFPYEIEPQVVGDLVICPSVVAKEATEQKKSLESHYAHLTIHGMLHLQGWDHENESEAAEMESEEVKILAMLGYANPYDS